MKSRFRDTKSRIGLMLRKIRNSRVKCNSSAEHKSRSLSIRDDSSIRIPHVIDGECEKGNPIGVLWFSGNTGKPEKPGKSLKNGKSGTVGKPGKTGRINGRQGIEPLIHNAYQAQLDMLSLAV